MRRRPVDPDLRAAVIARDGHVCTLCGIPVREGVAPAPDALNLDHVVQIAIGGENTLENLRVVCAACNQRRPKPVTEEAAQNRASLAPVARERRELRRLRPRGVHDPIAAQLTAASARMSARQRRALP